MRTCSLRFISPILAILLLGSVFFAASPKPGKSPVTHGWTRADTNPSRVSSRALLYDQTDNDSGNGAVDQNYETEYDSLDSEGADDFVVPDGVSWNVNQINTIGYSRPPNSVPTLTVNVSIYADNDGMPAATPLVTRLNIVATNNSGSLQIPISPVIHLEAGHYWLAVQTNQSFNPGGRVHFWGVRGVQSLNGAVWRNPGEGQGTTCVSWGRLLNCLDVQSDFLFSISGDLAQPIPAVDGWGIGALLATLVIAGYWVATRRNG